jgi:hypothetical protein
MLVSNKLPPVEDLTAALHDQITQLMEDASSDIPMPSDELVEYIDFLERYRDEFAALAKAMSKAQAQYDDDRFTDDSNEGIDHEG